ncbi:sel1/tetratricopeptide repeat protein [Neisseria meningitidis]|nr:sel1/tetratricopeptide repeat protein [Neisseria meningitidis]
MTAAPDILYRQAAALLEQSNTAQALPLLQQAAEQGYAEAAFVLGNHLLQNGQPEQALSWLEAAAAQRHPKALFSLLQQREHNGTPTGQLLNDYAWLGEQGHSEAQLILMRYHAQRNDPQSLYWAELAAARYAAPAYYHLARHHQRQGDVETAIEQYEKAAALGVTAACWQLGQIYFYGTGVSPNHAQAEHYLEPAAQAGHIAAQTLLADLLAAQRKPEALEWYRRAADKEQAEAQSKLAQYALTGELSRTRSVPSGTICQSRCRERPS